MTLRLGAKLPHSGPLATRLGVVEMAGRLEAAGFDSIWVSDHVVFPGAVRSRYPFSADGRITWPVDVDYLEPVVTLAAIAATTSRAELGTSVLILPMRNPVLFAKQTACIDLVSGGRLVLGVGVGWLREEYVALGADFDARGAILDEWLSIARQCWTGAVGPFAGRHYTLEEMFLCRPRPVRPPPILIGGMSGRALKRAGHSADGWVAQFSVDDLSEDVIAKGVDAMQRAATDRPDWRFQVVTRVTGAASRLDELAGRLRSIEAAGATEIVVDVDWEDEHGPMLAFDILRAAVG